MEEKKLDLNSIIGFGLIFVILIWVMYNSQQNEAKEKAKQAQQEQVEAKEKPAPSKTATTETKAVAPVSDSVQVAKLQSSLGSFAYSASLPSATEAFTTIENEVVRLKIANKGGYIVEAEMKEFEQFRKGSGKKVHLIKDKATPYNVDFYHLYPTASVLVLFPTYLLHMVLPFKADKTRVSISFSFSYGKN